MPSSADSRDERPDLPTRAAGSNSWSNSGSTSSVGLSEWARRLAPALDIVSASDPEPLIEEGTVIAVFTSTDDARALMLSWERLESADQSVGFVALGTAPDRESTVPTSPDPEGVVKDSARRAVIGALIGAGVGVLVAVVIGVAFGWGTGSIAALFAAPALGAVAGAVLVFVLRTGWGEGYRQSYVNPESTALAVCAISCREADHRDKAVAAARSAHARDVFVVDANGTAQHK
jgi:hypothetical protein